MDNKGTLLVGPSNFIDWHRGFTRNAKEKDVWDLLSGEFKPIATEPDIDNDKYQSAPTTITTTPTGNTVETRQNVGGRELRSLGISTPGAFDNDSGNNAAPTPNPTTSSSIVLPDNTPFLRFQHDHRKWEKGQKKIKAARTLIKNSVGPIITGLIRNKDDPVDAYKYLVEKYKPSDTAARQKLLNLLKESSLNKHKYNVEDYVNKIFDLREDLKDYSKELTDEEVCEYILAGLPDSYSNFREKYGWLMRYQGDPDGHDLQALTDELIKEGTRREETAKAKKAKSQNDVKNNKGKSEDNNAKPSVKCTHCSKAHPTEKCWFLHPELMPEHIKKKRDESKSNKDAVKTKVKTEVFAGLADADADLDSDVGI